MKTTDGWTSNVWENDLLFCYYGKSFSPKKKSRTKSNNHHPSVGWPQQSAPAENLKFSKKFGTKKTLQHVMELWIGSMNSVMTRECSRNKKKELRIVKSGRKRVKALCVLGERQKCITRVHRPYAAVPCVCVSVCLFEIDAGLGSKRNWVSL